MITTEFRLSLLLSVGLAVSLTVGCGETRGPIREGVSVALAEPGSVEEPGETPPGEDPTPGSEGDAAGGAPVDDAGFQCPSSEEPIEECPSSEEPTEESSGSEDPSSGAEGAGSQETAPDSDPWAGRPLGQCTQSSDCPEGPNGRRCSRSLPGGACTGCGGDEHCPGSTVCYVGTCVQECEALADCPPGLYCLGSGRCGTSWCVDGDCPVSLFTCTPTMRCERAACESPGECPERTTCVAGRCMEDRALMQ